MSILIVDVDAQDLNLGKMKYFAGKLCILSQYFLKLGQEEVGFVKPRGD